MAKPLGHYINSTVAQRLYPLTGDSLEHLTMGDKAAIIGTIGLYLQGKHDTLDEFEDSEPWTELNDGWTEHPLVASGRVQELLTDVLNVSKDKDVHQSKSLDAWGHKSHHTSPVSPPSATHIWHPPQECTTAVSATV